MNSVFSALVIGIVFVSAAASSAAQPPTFTVTVVPTAHGTLQLVPPVPPDGRYPAGTVVTVRTAPDRGYVLDSAWYSVPWMFGQMYHEGMAREFPVTIDRDKRIGASFIEEAAVRHVDVTHDVVYAKPGVKPLKYDVFSPKGARNLPVIVIIHGGGWVANAQEFLDALVKAGQRAEYVQVGGAGHAFFDWKPDDNTKATFARYGVYYAAAMKAFFESVLF